MPFLSVLAYSECDAAEQGKQHKKLTGWGREILMLAQPRWPKRRLVVVALPPTFSDTLALVRKELWAHTTFCELSREPDTVKARGRSWSAWQRRFAM